MAVKQLTVTGVDPATRTVTTSDGQTFTGDYLVLAAGSRPNFFHTPGAEQHAFPLYTVDDAKALRNRLFEVFEAADNDPARIDEGALNIVIVGAGPTGVETAGAVADLVNEVMPKRFHDLDVKRTRIYLDRPRPRRPRRLLRARPTTTPPASWSTTASPCASAPASARSPPTG